VSAGPCACNLVGNASAISKTSASEITTSAGKHLLFTANDLGIFCSLLVSARDRNSGQ